jgi:prepilin-type N-terminal cleavage/methylation domain-containing protein
MYTPNTQRGFTLIELLVSVALFTIVMVTALGALLSLSAASRRAQAFKSAIDNLSSAVESMTRNIRTGSGYHCGSLTGGNCTTGGVNNYTFVFTAFNGQTTYYRLENTTTDSANAATVCGQTSGTVGCLARSTDGTNWLAITAPEVVVESVGYPFYVFGTAVGSADNIQPRVIFTVRGYVQVTGTIQIPFNIQTNVTQRIYDQ